MLWFLINCIFQNKEFHYLHDMYAARKMKDTASIFTYMMCRKIYDPTSNHWPMGTYIVFCDFIKPRQKWFTLSRCCLEEFHNSICCQLYPELIKPVTLTSTFIFSKRSIFLISFNYQWIFLIWLNIGRNRLWSHIVLIASMPLSR